MHALVVIALLETRTGGDSTITKANSLGFEKVKVVDYTNGYLAIAELFTSGVGYCGEGFTIYPCHFW